MQKTDLKQLAEEFVTNLLLRQKTKEEMLHYLKLHDY